MQKHTITPGELREIEEAFDNVEGMAGKYLQPELGETVARAREIIRRVRA